MLEKDLGNIEECLYAINSIEEYVADFNSIEELQKNNMAYDAAMMNFIIVGEACQRISDDLKIKHPQIDWKGINGFRNFIAHDYFGLDENVVWAAITVKYQN